MAKGKRREKRDKDAPKKALTPYFIFMSERRPELKKEKPTLDHKQIIFELGAEWNKMKDEDKQKYKLKAEEDKKRYEKENAAYDSKNSTEKGKAQ